MPTKKPKPKTPAKKTPARKPAPVKSRGRELSEAELEKVAGGAAYIKLVDIPGEYSKHKDEIEVLSYSWGVTPTASPGTPLRKKK